VTDSDGLAAVVAHGLLNTLTVIGGAAELLRTEWDVISPSRREELFTLIEVHVGEAGEALRGLVLGLPPEALAMLDELSRLRSEPLPAEVPRLRRRRTDAPVVG
jgi:signal transduction histidine kinase